VIWFRLEVAPDEFPEVENGEMRPASKSFRDRKFPGTSSSERRQSWYFRMPAFTWAEFSHVTGWRLGARRRGLKRRSL
jgi:hypothetical protein